MADDITVFRRRQPEDRAGPDRGRLEDQPRRHGGDLICRQLATGQADPGRRAGRPVHLGLDRLDGRGAKTGNIDPATRRDLLGNTLVLVGTSKPARRRLPICRSFWARTNWPWRWSIPCPPANIAKRPDLAEAGTRSGAGRAGRQRPRRAEAGRHRRGAPWRRLWQRCGGRAGRRRRRRLPADSHAPITYPAAVTSNADTPQAAVFLDSLSEKSRQGQFSSRKALPLRNDSNRLKRPSRNGRPSACP